LTTGFLQVRVNVGIQIIVYIVKACCSIPLVASGRSLHQH
jgi:hypothetical protein